MNVRRPIVLCQSLHLINVEEVRKQLKRMTTLKAYLIAIEVWKLLGDEC